MGPQKMLASIVVLTLSLSIPSIVTKSRAVDTDGQPSSATTSNATNNTTTTTNKTTVTEQRKPRIRHLGNKPMFVKNVECSPQPQVINTDPLSYYRYTPGVIKLHRCQGADSPQSLHYKTCVPSDDGIEEVDVSVINNNYQTPLTLTVRNHTSCVEKCALEEGLCSPYQTFQPDTCVCKCEYDRAPDPYPCTDPFFWEPSMCDCVCGVESKECEGTGKEFNERTCKCECKLMAYVRCARSKKQVDEKTCKCIENK